MFRARLLVTLRFFRAHAPVLLTRVSSSRFSPVSCEYRSCQHMSSRLLRQSLQLAPRTRSFVSVVELAHQVLSMPALSPTMNQGNVTNWKKKEGDKVAVGDVLCEIETDKATLDFESLEEGFLAKILVPAGSKDVPVGQPIAIIVEQEEGISKFSGSGLTGENHKVAQGNTENVSKSQKHTRIGPSVRRLLAESGLDISSFTGTGPGGIVTKGDILVALKSGTQPEKATSIGKIGKYSTNTAVLYSPALQKSIPSGGLPSFSELVYEDMPTSHIRKVIAKRLSESKNRIPHIYLSTDALLDETLALRKELKEKHGVNTSVNDFVIRAVAFSLKAVPGANAYWDEKAGEIVLSTSVDISIAVATDKGLMTPILHNADQKALSTISSEVKALIEKARRGSLAPHEFQGGSFSISNLGMLDVDRFCAIINPPQACILAIGRGEQAVIWEEDMNGQGRPRCATKIALTLSADHRVFNVDLGGQFLDTLSRIFRNPRRLLL